MEYWLVIRWLAVYLFLFLAGLPLAAVLCPRLADRGAGIAIPLSLAILGLTGYWIGRVSFGWLPIGVGLTIFCGLAVVLLRSDRITVAIDSRSAIETALVFTLAFSALVAIRAVDPAVHPSGGEKFLDYGLLRSLLRTSALPPEDIWFAGEPLTYYYGGHMLSALLAKLTATEASYAYNLALAGFYATLVTTTYGLAGSLGASIGTARSTAGVLGAFFVGVASNLQTPFRALLLVLPEQTARTISDAVGAEVDGLAVSWDEFSYWNASRIISGQPGASESYRIATEFPLFSWLNGDLHAHMMSMSFLLLVGTLCFSYYCTPATEHTRRRLLIGACGVLAGLIAITNTWSFPTVFGLLWLTLSFSPTRPLSLLPARLTTRIRSLRHSEHTRQPWRVRELRRAVSSTVLVGAVAPIGIAVSLPFWFGTAGNRAIALVSTRSSALSLLLVHGGFLSVFGPYLISRARPAVNLASIATVVVSSALVGVIGVLLHMRLAVFVLIAPLALGAWVLLRRSDDRNRPENTQRPSAGFPSVLILAGAGLVLIVEIIYLQEQAGPGRYNTVFKTYMQVWVLWSVAGGAALADIAHPRAARSRSGQSLRVRLQRLVPMSGVNVQRRVASTIAGIGFRRVVVLVLLFSTSIYGSLALTTHFTTVNHTSPEEPTLDALAFVETTHPTEAAAIHWLDQRTGHPVVAAAPGTDTYQWTNPESSLTGLPTIAGWSHEIGYRTASVYYERVDDVDTLYQGSPSQTIEMLRRYDVRYIYVGPNERDRYGRVSFEQIAGLERHRFGAVAVYEVHQSRLAVRS